MKPVCIVMPGPSVQELEDRIQEFKDFDVTWATVCGWEVLLQYFILDKIDKKFKVVFDERFIKFNVGMFGNLLADLVIRGCSPIFLFGCDGGELKSYPNAYYKVRNRKCPDVTADSVKINSEFTNWTIGKKSEIYNVSIESNLGLFERITYDEAILKLKGF